MVIHKEITKDNELMLYRNGELIYKRWLNTGQSIVRDVMAYDKYTHVSYTDLDIKDSKFIIRLTAKLRLKTIEEGGRINGIKSGYRPNHVFEYEENGQLKEAFMGEVLFSNPDWLEPGFEREVHVRFISSQRIEEYLAPGQKWYLHEGLRVVGEAEILNFDRPEEAIS